MGQNPKFPGYNWGNNQGNKVKYIFSTFIHSTTIAGAGQHPFDTCRWISCCACLYDTHDVGPYPSNFDSTLGQCRSLLLVQCRQIGYDSGPTLFQHWVCCVPSSSTPANTCHLPNAVSMLAQRLWRWPDIKTVLGDCPVFAWTV